MATRHEELKIIPEVPGERKTTLEVLRVAKAWYRSENSVTFLVKLTIGLETGGDFSMVPNNWFNQKSIEQLYTSSRSNAELKTALLAIVPDYEAAQHAYFIAVGRAHIRTQTEIKEGHMEVVTDYLNGIPETAIVFASSIASSSELGSLISISPPATPSGSARKIWTKSTGKRNSGGYKNMTDWSGPKRGRVHKPYRN